MNVSRSGDLSAPASVDYTTGDAGSLNGCAVRNGNASSRCDYITSVGTLRFAAGESSKLITIHIIDDAYAEGDETLTVTLGNAAGASVGTPGTAAVVIRDNETADGTNPVDNSAGFVRAHYLDFLNREPDAPGLAFWVNEIEKCGADAQCREVKRINVSAAFFLSIEFQETGYLVYKTYKSAYGDATSPGVSGTIPVVRLGEFLADTQQIGRGVIVGVGDWQAQLEANKVAYFQEFVSRPRFAGGAPLTMTPAQFVDALYLNVGVTPTAAQRQAALDEFGGSSNTSNRAARARVLRHVAEDPALHRKEFNRAFVLMEYFGYLRRNPDDAPEATLNFAGWKFWLTKLEQFNGNFVAAEMVKAFISSDEYRRRFGP